MIEIIESWVIARETGARKNARVLRCCDQDHFVLFQLEGQTHLHLQCAWCAMSYCPDNTCTDVEGL
jgi:hypothetical protein